MAMRRSIQNRPRVPVPAIQIYRHLLLRRDCVREVSNVRNGVVENFIKQQVMLGNLAMHKSDEGQLADRLFPVIVREDKFLAAVHQSKIIVKERSDAV